MPAIRYWEVTQSRSVRVESPTAGEAMVIAGREFAKAQPEEDLVPEGELRGRAISSVQVDDLEVRKERY